ncbi:MAG TPA: phosphatidylserine decarboxylase [Stellaceae bacterium]|nr:phosphatidylserine decarboxylase [Stellaceae bacterium]
MLKYVVAPIHPEGWRFVAIFAAASVLLFWLWRPLGWLGVIATLWCLYFFRDPWRVTALRPGLVVAPADGTIVAIGPAKPPAELDMGEAAMLRIAIFLSIFDVHVNRMPMSGRIRKCAYRAGKFLNASLDKASDENERMAIRLASAEGADIAVVQVAGLIARRIRCSVHEGQEVMAGERFGIIRFGSRAEVYLPLDWTPLVMEGQRAVGGETAIADARPGTPPARFWVH